MVHGSEGCEKARDDGPSSHALEDRALEWIAPFQHLPAQSPPSVAMRPRAAKRSPMSGASLPATQADDGGRETFSQSLGQCGSGGGGFALRNRPDVATRPARGRQRQTSPGRKLRSQCGLRTGCLLPWTTKRKLRLELNLAC